MIADNLNIKSSEKSIQNHLRNYYSDFISKEEIPLSSYFDTYTQMSSSLHKKANSSELDISALSYSLPRLPDCIFITHKIIFAQNEDQLKTINIHLSGLEIHSSPRRRRLYYFDPESRTLIAMMNSDSDIDDLLNNLIVYGIERLKLTKFPAQNVKNTIELEKYELMGIDMINWQKLKTSLGPNWKENLKNMAIHQELYISYCLKEKDIYETIASNWWQQACTSSLIFEFNHTPLYFVSSNLHSFVNIIGGFVNKQQDSILRHTEKFHPDLYQEWQKLKDGQNKLRVIEFLYYISSRYFNDLTQELISKTNYEESLNIKTIKLKNQLCCDAQIIPVSAIAKSNYKDPNLLVPDLEKLLNSRAYIFNIEYPLGYSAYYLLKEILNTLENLKGVYIIGKAAILNGAVGDIQIPKIVFDERTNNIVFPDNIFNRYFPFKAFQTSILKDQKAISVYGTLLENETQLQNYISSGFNIVEMESGPYLNAIYQHQAHLNHLPHDVTTRLEKLPYDLGLINYASDNPLSQTLGDNVLSLKGIEPTYLASLSVVQRIIDLESV